MGAPLMLTNLAVVLGLTIYWEASKCSEAEMRMVASTIWNRAVEKPGAEFNPMDLWYVVTAPAQYSCVRDRLLASAGSVLVPNGSEDLVWRYCLALGHALVVSARTGRADGFRVSANVTHYYLRSMPDPPSWGHNMDNVVDMPYHRFGRPRPLYQ